MNTPTYRLEVINKGISYQPCVWAYYADDCQYKVLTIGTDLIDADAAKAVIKTKAAKDILRIVENNPGLFK